MKRFILGGAALAALVAVPALAVQQRPAAQSATRANVQAMVQTHFAQADSDRDGFLTKAEAEAATTAMRSQRQQMRGARQAQREERRNAMFARLDADGNGAISRDEFNARPDRAQRDERRAERMARRAGRGRQGGMMMGMRLGARAFDRADADQDGRVSLAEASARPLAAFARADANADGMVTVEERRAARASRPRR